MASRGSLVTTKLRVALFFKVGLHQLGHQWFVVDHHHLGVEQRRAQCGRRRRQITLERAGLCIGPDVHSSCANLLRFGQFQSAIDPMRQPRKLCQMSARRSGRPVRAPPLRAPVRARTIRRNPCCHRRPSANAPVPPVHRNRRAAAACPASTSLAGNCVGKAAGNAAQLGMACQSGSQRREDGRRIGEFIGRPRIQLEIEVQLERRLRPRQPPVDRCGCAAGRLIVLYGDAAAAAAAGPPRHPPAAPAAQPGRQVAHQRIDIDRLGQESIEAAGLAGRPRSPSSHWPSRPRSAT